MRLAIDLQACQTPGSRKRGIGRYSFELARAMVRVGGGHEFAMLANDAFPESLGDLRRDVESMSDRVRFATYSLLPLDGLVDAERRRAQEANDHLLNWHYARLHADAVHVSSVFEGWLAGPAHVSARPADLPGSVFSATLYDLIPLVLRERYLSEPVVPAYMRNLRVFDQLDVVLAISESARRDVVSRLGLAEDRVISIGGAAGPEFRTLPAMDRAERESLLRRHAIRDRFLMYTGGIDYRKNIEGLLDAYARLPARLTDTYQLAIVCAATEDQKREVLRHARRAGIDPQRVSMTGFVSDEDLVALYNLCELFVFPSLYEGFGLPVLEAMKCGRCVVASDRSSLPELVTDPRARFDPDDPEDIARVIASVLDDELLRRELADVGTARTQAMTWEACAATALAAIEEAVARKSATAGDGPAGGRRPRIAYFSPLPDRRSGIADYSAVLLPRLARHLDAELFVDDYRPTDLRLTTQHVVLPAGEFPGRRARYEAVLFHFGNSEFHMYMYDLALEYPGVFVMHDFFLSGLIHYIGHRRGDPGLFERELVRAHGAAAEAALRAYRSGQRTLQSLLYEFPTNRRLLARARGLIFHSEFAKNLFHGACPDLWRVPVAVIPHFAEPTSVTDGERQEIRARLGVSERDLLIACFGYVAETKQNHLLLDALEDPALRTRTDLQIALVGELTTEPYGKEIKRRIRSSSHRERIRITGYVSEVDYFHYLHACDVVVALRAHSRGETSGGLHRALGAGRACIVTDEAAFAETSREAVVHVAPGSVPDLANALRSLVEDPLLRGRLGAAASRYAASALAPSVIAGRYAAAIRRFIALSSSASIDMLAEGLALAEEDAGVPASLSRQVAEIASDAVRRDG